MRHRAGFYEKYGKRFFDFFLSGMALIILSPVLLVTAILVRVKLGSPVIFCQERPGKDEQIFKLHKFRSMSDARDKNGWANLAASCARQAWMSFLSYGISSAER